MKLSKLALAGAIAGLLSAGTAYAQSGLGQGVPAHDTAFEYNSYYAQDDTQSPSDQGAAPAAPAAACNSCDSCGGLFHDNPCGWGSGNLLNPCCTTLGDQWKLVDQFPCAKCKGINIAGWLAQSYTWNTANPADRFNGPVTWTDRANEYQLNQLYLYAEKATDTKGCGVDFGYRADVMFGTDYRFNTAAGLETRGPVEFQHPVISQQRFYGTAFTQFYGEVAIDNLKIKAGHWYAPVGYEVVPTTGNFFPSLPYTFQYGEPFTMTGVIATYQANENVSYGGGVIHGWDNFANVANKNASFVGTYTEKFSDGAALAIANTIGNEPNQQTSAAGAVTSFRYLQTNVYSRPLKGISDKLNYVAQSDFGYQSNALLNGHVARWYGLNQYLFYKVSDRLTYGIRSEWFRDEEGYRVGGFLGTTDLGSLRGLSTTRSGYQGNFYETTMGANYKFSANTTIRPYARFDWFSGTALNGAGTLPFNNGFGNSQTLLGFDLITIY